MGKTITEKEAKSRYRKGVDFMPNEGMQSMLLKNIPNVDIAFIGGNRGGGKSGVIMLDPLYDINNPNFTATYFRKEMPQIEAQGGLWPESMKFFKPLGAEFIVGKHIARFPSGASIYYRHAQNEDPKVFEKTMQGLQSAAIYIDEITHLKFFETFNYIRTCVRSDYIENKRLIATCNPDPHSWVRRFLDQRYLDCSGGINDGCIIPEMNGKIQYFYVYGKNEDDIIWGNTKQEVIDAAGDLIVITDSLRATGANEEDMITSFVFYLGDLAENKFLGKDYLSNIGGGSMEQKARNLLGNWHVASDGDEMVKRKHIDNMFDRTKPINNVGHRYLTFDIAYGGSDMAIFCEWQGLHLLDITARKKMGGTELPPLVESLCREGGIFPEHVAYDAVAIGQSLKGENGYLPDAFPVEARGRPLGGGENIYETIKDQIIYVFAKMLIEGEITISDNLRYKTFPYGKKKDEQKTIYDILQNERRILLDLDTDGKKRCLRKKEMIKLLGFSPDFLESMAYIVIFHIANANTEIEGLMHL